MLTSQGVSEQCHFCKQRVYLMEKISAEGLVLHRSCLKCHHCHTNLRLGRFLIEYLLSELQLKFKLNFFSQQVVMPLIVTTPMENSTAPNILNYLLKMSNSYQNDFCTSRDNKSWQHKDTCKCNSKT